MASHKLHRVSYRRMEHINRINSSFSSLFVPKYQINPVTQELSYIITLQCLKLVKQKVVTDSIESYVHTAHIIEGFQFFSTCRLINVNSLASFLAHGGSTTSSTL